MKALEYLLETHPSLFRECEKSLGLKLFVKYLNASSIGFGRLFKLETTEQTINHEELKVLRGKFDLYVASVQFSPNFIYRKANKIYFDTIYRYSNVCVVPSEKVVTYDRVLVYINSYQRKYYNCHLITKDAYSSHCWIVPK